MIYSVGTGEMVHYVQNCPFWAYSTTVFAVWVMPTAGWMNGLSGRNQRLVAKDVEIFTKRCQLPLARVVCWLRTKGIRRFFAVQKDE